jgi:hypothetical protein
MLVGEGGYLYLHTLVLHEFRTCRGERYLNGILPKGCQAPSASAARLAATTCCAFKKKKKELMQ